MAKTFFSSVGRSTKSKSRKATPSTSPRMNVPDSVVVPNKPAVIASSFGSPSTSSTATSSSIGSQKNQRINDSSRGATGPSSHKTPNVLPVSPSRPATPRDKPTSNLETKIQVCVRVRPMNIMASSSEHTSPIGTPIQSRIQTPTSRITSRLRTPSASASATRKRTTKSGFDQPERPAWTMQNPTTIVQSPWTNLDPTRKNCYTFDRIYAGPTVTSSIYNSSVRPLVSAAMDGYHSSVFAYGQTSTGKTYTMRGTKSHPGIIPLAIQDCFSYIERTPQREFLFRVSYLEIYNESINDLLAPPPIDPRSGAARASSIRIFESKEEGVVVRGLKEEIVTSPDQIITLIEEGEKVRKTGSTNLNKQSSRSHSIFRLIVESRQRKNYGDAAGVDGDSVSSSVGGPVRVSTLNLIDLAGSESVKATGSTGERQKEGQYINKSLMTLGHVIWKLSEIANAHVPKSGPNSTDKHKHIPYRDSKLTRLLQPSLSGNAQICIICNISPSAHHVEESHNTLKFAQRAKRIKQSAIITEVTDEKTLLQNYREEIMSLKKQLKDARVEPQKEKEEATTSEDVKVLVYAIKNLEKLILTNEVVPVGRPAPPSPIPIPTPRPASPTDKPDKEVPPEECHIVQPKFLDYKNTSPGPQSDTSSVISLTHASTDGENNRHQENLVEELHRIQNLLNSVLVRKTGAARVVVPEPLVVERAVSPPPGDDRHGAVVCKTPEKDVEVERLKARLQTQEVASALRQADSSFLESQLMQKDLLLQEVSKVLDAVERRHVELERKNARLKLQLSDCQETLAFKESKLMQMELGGLVHRVNSSSHLNDLHSRNGEEEPVDDDEELFSNLLLE